MSQSLERITRLAQRRQVMEIVGFPVACGGFISRGDVPSSELEKPGWALIPHGINDPDGLFIARAFGNSMCPRIRHGDYVIFRYGVPAFPESKILLVEEFSNEEFLFTLKKYHKEGPRVWLLPLNPDHQPLLLTGDGDCRILGWFVAAVPDIVRVEKAEFPFLDEGWENY